MILTLGFTEADFKRLDDLRRAHFPAERNLIPAHLTLFHALPGEEREAVIAAAERAAADRAPFDVVFTGLRKLGRGVALEARSVELVGLRADLARAFAPWLTAQDRQGFRPHVTIQNKVEPAEAAALHARLSADFAPWSARAEAVRVWRYLGGPWGAEATLPLGQATGAASAGMSATGQGLA